MVKDYKELLQLRREAFQRRVPMEGSTVSKALGLEAALQQQSCKGEDQTHDRMGLKSVKSFSFFWEAVGQRGKGL